MKNHRGSIVKSFANIHSTLCPIAFALLVLNAAVYAQTLPSTDKSIVLETEDGMIVIGKIEKCAEGIADVKTAFGALNIPLNKILRVDGDRFDPALGLVREHTATVRPDGGVILEYLQTVSANAVNRTVNILALGNVLNVFDLNGEPLDFMATKVGDFTRCSIDMPEYRLPAVRVQILQAGAASLKNDRLYYTYRYTPRIEQTLRFKVTIPAGATVVQSDPEPAERVDNALIWQEPLRRQQNFDLSLILGIE